MTSDTRIKELEKNLAELANIVSGLHQGCWSSGEVDQKRVRSLAKRTRTQADVPELSAPARSTVGRRFR